MKKFIIVALACIATLTSCKDSGNLLPSVTGTIYENLVVMETPYWKGAPGDSVRRYLASDMECMPQIEPLFSLSHTNFNGFSSILKPVRNIFIAAIDSTKYTQGKISYYKNQWAKPQAVVKVAAPNKAEFESLMHIYGKSIILLPVFYIRHKGCQRRVCAHPNYLCKLLLKGLCLQNIYYKPGIHLL
jgi:hypothetical protein